MEGNIQSGLGTHNDTYMSYAYDHIRRLQQYQTATRHSVHRNDMKQVAQVKVSRGTGKTETVSEWMMQDTKT
jgi:hypothetical protein